jgi:hypothetical protein
MCTGLLPPDVNPIAVNKYLYIISYAGRYEDQPYVAALSTFLTDLSKIAEPHAPI